MLCYCGNHSSFLYYNCNVLATLQYHYNFSPWHQTPPDMKDPGVRYQHVLALLQETEINRTNVLSNPCTLSLTSDPPVCRFDKLINSSDFPREHFIFSFLCSVDLLNYSNQYLLVDWYVVTWTTFKFSRNFLHKWLGFKVVQLHKRFF